MWTVATCKGTPLLRHGSGLVKVMIIFSLDMAIWQTFHRTNMFRPQTFVTWAALITHDKGGIFLAGGFFWLVCRSSTHFSRFLWGIYWVCVCGKFFQESEQFLSRVPWDLLTGHVSTSLSSLWASQADVFPSLGRQRIPSADCYTFKTHKQIKCGKLATWEAHRPEGDRAMCGAVVGITHLLFSLTAMGPALPVLLSGILAPIFTTPASAYPGNHLSL